MVSGKAEESSLSRLEKICEMFYAPVLAHISSLKNIFRQTAYGFNEKLGLVEFPIVN